jgi:hypothetical protein
MTYNFYGKGFPASTGNIEPTGICDGTGFLHRKRDLVKQMEWRGNRLVWTGFLVGKDYVDTPNEQLRTPVLPPDPIPVRQPRPYQPNNLTFSNNYNVPIGQLKIRFSELSGDLDGVPAVTTEERLRLLQQGGNPGYPNISPTGYLPAPTLTPQQNLEQLQSFNWNSEGS